MDLFIVCSKNTAKPFQISHSPGYFRAFWKDEKLFAFKIEAWQNREKIHLKIWTESNEA